MFEVHLRLQMFFACVLGVQVSLAFPAYSQEQPPARGPEIKSAGSPTGAVPPKGSENIETRIKEIEARLKEIGSSAEMAQELKERVLEQYSLALRRLQQAAASTARGATFSRTFSEAPAKTEEIRQKLAQPSTPKPQPPESTEATTSKQLEQVLLGIQADLAKAKSRRSDLQAEVQKEKNRPDQARQELAQAKQKLEELAEEGSRSVEAGQPQALVEAQKAAAEALRTARLAETAALEQELLSYDVRLEFLTAQAAEADQEVASLDARRQAVQEAANKRRLVEAEQERKRAEDAQESAKGKHPAVQALADRTVEAGKELEKIGRDIEQTTKRTEGLLSQTVQLDKDLVAAKERITKAGLSEVVGRILRRQRRELPDPREYERQTEARETESARLELSLIDTEEELAALRDLDAKTRETMDSVDEAVPDSSRAEIEGQIRKLLETRKDLLRKLGESYRSYLRKLVDLDQSQKELVSSAEAYADFLDEHLLWIRSAEPLNRDLPQETVDAGLWLATPAYWLETANAVGVVVRRVPVGTAVSFLFLLAILVTSRRARRHQEWVQARVGKAQTDRFGLTVEALLVDLVLVLPWPLVLGFFAWCIRADPTAGEFPKAVAAGVWTGAVLVFAFHFLWRLVKRDGVVQLHFRWRPRSLECLRRRTLWLVCWAVVLPAAALVSVMVSQGNESHIDSLGRLSFIVLMAAIAYLVAGTLHPTGGVLAERLEAVPNGWLSKLRNLWYPGVVAVPLALIVLAGLGYLYTAFELGGNRLQATILLFLGAVLLHNLLLRWLYVAQRRMAWEKAREERKTRQAAAAVAAAAASGGDQPPEAEAQKPLFETPEEPVIDLRQLNQQARHLLGTLIGTSVFVGLWLIWASVLPAFEILDEARLWKYTETDWITLKHVAAAGIIALITAVAGRNLPGALELTILQRLPIEPGGRYAITTVCQYLIVVIGVVFTFHAIGIGWSHVQWLVAAVSVGLGFGLQEIFANFVSGIILLFERPIRVGDIVTIGDISGVVTRIRMRATTVRNWDRKELVVPNKEFITGRLLNWTLSDAVNRVVIEVGVAYGSDTELAKETLLRVANDHPLILDDPAPIATFEGFGESALNLVLRCFLPNLENRLPVIHELYTAIDRAFREARIEIAFPQRDLHLRSAHSPIELVNKEEPSWSLEGGEHRSSDAAGK